MPPEPIATIRTRSYVTCQRTAVGTVVGRNGANLKRIAREIRGCIKLYWSPREERFEVVSTDQRAAKMVKTALTTLEQRFRREQSAWHASRRRRKPRWWPASGPTRPICLVNNKANSERLWARRQKAERKHSHKQQQRGGRVPDRKHAWKTKISENKSLRGSKPVPQPVRYRGSKVSLCVHDHEC